MAEETLVPNQSGSVSPETEPKADIPGVAEKRKPGRPPKAPPAAADANYTPSIERNNEQQAYQPTAGTGVAGYGDWDDFDESALADTTETWKPEPVLTKLATLVPKEFDSPAPIKPPDANEKLFPVFLKRNYRPATDRWYPVLADGRVGRQPKREEGDSIKVMAGYKVLLPLSEARQLIERGLAVRADDLPIG